MTNRVVFTPSGLDGDVETGTSVLDAFLRDVLVSTWIRCAVVVVFAVAVR